MLILIFIQQRVKKRLAKGFWYFCLLYQPLQRFLLPTAAFLAADAGTHWKMDNHFYWAGLLFGLIQLCIQRYGLIKRIRFEGDHLQVEYLNLLFGQSTKSFPVSDLQNISIQKRRICPTVLRLKFEYKGSPQGFSCLLDQEEELRQEVWKLPCV